MEYRHCRKSFFGIFAFACLVTIFTILGLVLDNGEAGSEASMLFVIIIALVSIGASICSAYSWLEIFLHMDGYTFFTATLMKPIVSHTRYHHSVRYSLTFPNKEGTIITRETASMFRNHTDPCLEDYNGKQVLVGYNEETDRLVVIKPLQH